MGENTGIEWAHHTFNPWWGCARVSPACDSCYAEREAKRFYPGRNLWGTDADRREFGDRHWNAPLRWNKQATAEGKRYRVFCASMADVFDNQAPSGARERLWELIKRTPSLDWLLLTKRIGNANRMLPCDWGSGYPNVWLGITVVTSDEVSRDVPKLQRVPARVRWLSMEPLLDAVDIGRFLSSARDDLPPINWVVVGGESGPRARPLNPTWARSVRDQCESARVPYFFKQWGEWAPTDSSAEVSSKSAQIYCFEQDPRPPLDRLHEVCMVRVGKQSAGRLLDGRIWASFPEPYAGRSIATHATSSTD